MSKIIPIENFSFDNVNFWAGFMAGAFPTALDEETDMSAAEIVQENELGYMEWWDDFTAYYDGVFDESDSYVDDPNCFEYKLTPEQTLRIEFHPGDIVYYVNDKQIGCTGPHYDIQKFSYGLLHKYLEQQENELIYMLLLPLAEIAQAEAESAKTTIISILQKIFAPALAEQFAGCIVYGLTD